MKNVRVWFEKTGVARYISHLDMTRSMSRALKLSGLPVWYTEGFNPRIYMTYAMPLSLGIRGERECMDIRLTEERDFPEIEARLNERLPEDIRVLEAAEPGGSFEDVAFAEYELLLESEDSAALEGALSALLGQERIAVIKHGKKGDKELDIKPYFADMRMERISPTALRLSVCLPCGIQGAVNPGLLLDALKNRVEKEPYADITRKRLLLKDFSDFR